MTREEIISLFHSSGLIRRGQTFVPDLVLAFAEKIAAAERERCAKVCEAIDEEYGGEDVHATWCANAIRGLK